MLPWSSSGSRGGGHRRGNPKGGKRMVWHRWHWKFWNLSRWPGPEGRGFTWAGQVPMLVSYGSGFGYRGDERRCAYERGGGETYWTIWRLGRFLAGSGFGYRRDEHR